MISEIWKHVTKRIWGKIQLKQLVNQFLIVGDSHSHGSGSHHQKYCRCSWTNCTTTVPSVGNNINSQTPEGYRYQYRQRIGFTTDTDTPNDHKSLYIYSVGRDCTAGSSSSKNLLDRGIHKNSLVIVTIRSLLTIEYKSTPLLNDEVLVIGNKHLPAIQHWDHVLKTNGRKLEGAKVSSSKCRECFLQPWAYWSAQSTCFGDLHLLAWRSDTNLVQFSLTSNAPKLHENCAQK